MKTELIPVIHVTGQGQAIDNVKMCVRNGIEKVFLIGHGMSIPELCDHANVIVALHPDLWVGINPLGKQIALAIQREWDGYKGLWCDQTLTDLVAPYRTYEGMLFTGLAFKYQPQPSDIKEACEEAKRCTDVATTSGVGTGKAADLDKIMKIREYLGDHPMAIASGVASTNVHNYKGVADYLLVASSITDSNECIIESKLVELQNKLA